MGAKLNLKGQKFGRLTILKEAQNRQTNHVYWLCQCDCGNIISVIAGNLNRVHTQSCGCLQKERARKAKTKHGHAINGLETKTYITWKSMIQRCKNSQKQGYKYYGGKGIAVCKRWKNFNSFLVDMGERPKGMTIDRIDHNGNYDPDNCRWATQRQQMRNSCNTKLSTLKVQIIKKLLKESNLKQWEIAELFNITRATIGNINTGKTWGDIIYNEAS